MRYLLSVLLLSACGVLTPVNKTWEPYSPIEMLGDFGEDDFEESVEEAAPEPEEVQPKPKKPRPVVVHGLLPPCKPDPTDKEKAILQQIECLAETADITESVK